MRDYRKIIKEKRGLRIKWVADQMQLKRSTLAMKLIGHRPLTKEDVKKLDKLLNLKPLKDATKTVQNKTYRSRLAQKTARA